MIRQPCLAAAAALLAAATVSTTARAGPDVGERPRVSGPRNVDGPEGVSVHPRATDSRALLGRLTRGRSPSSHTASEHACDAAKLFARENLVAWCIVPFDAKKRTPAERVEMLKKLGFKKYAYDWRAEHLPSFDEEVGLLKKAGIELTAVWVPANLGPDARKLLEVVRKHDAKTQLWITMGDPGGKTREEKVAAAAKVLRPIAEEAAKVGCAVALYNHGGWFGEPENLVAVIEALNLKNVGIVYNQHHGHDHAERFAELLKAMKPHLLALNINGMARDGEKMGKKILPLGAGELDAKLLKVIAESGYTGSVGILGHTRDDAEERLRDNLDGLDWLLPQLAGNPAGPRPTYRTHKSKE